MIPVLRWIVAAALTCGSLIVLSAVVDGELGHTRGQGLVSLVVIVLGGTFVITDLVFPATRKQRILGWAGVGFTAAAVTMSLVLVWSELITNRYLWKGWWLASALAVHIAHVLALLHARTSPRRLLVLRNATLVAAVCFVLLLIGMTFREDVLAMPGGVLTVSLYVLGAAQILGSLALWIWAHPAQRTLRLPAKVLVAWKFALPVCILAVGFYLGRVTSPHAGVLDCATGHLAGLTPKAIDEQIEKDLNRLYAVVEGIERLRVDSRELHESLLERRKTDRKMILTPLEEQEIRALFFSFLSYRTALLRMVAYYQGYEGVSDPKRRSRCFLTGYAAGTICLSVSLSLVERYRKDDLVRDKLNEAEPRSWIPEGMFDQIQVSVASRDNLSVFEEMAAFFEKDRDRWRECGFESKDLAFLETTIEHAVATIRTNSLYGKPLWMPIILARVKKDAYSPVYAVQSIVSTWIGDTRLLSRPPCISATHVEVLREKLEPGDIILERRNWFLSNAFLPGFWPHAALYVGTEDDITRLGIAEEPAVRDRLERYRTRAHDGEPKVVIESISEGVTFTSLSEATRADYIAVLRPNVSDEAKAQAILRAFGYEGNPYDFEFDFDSSDKLVCTELVYRSYFGMIDFQLELIMGRKTLPALKIAEKFRDERKSPDKQLEFVCFLDTPEGSRQAQFADEATFVESATRPRAFNE